LNREPHVPLVVTINRAPEPVPAGRGPQRLAGYRDQAGQVAGLVGAPDDAVKALSQMIGAALGTQQVVTSSRALTARQKSLPYDQDRVRLLSQLADRVRLPAPQNRPVADPGDQRYAYLPLHSDFV
jgi:hypothetical protein